MAEQNSDSASMVRIKTGIGALDDMLYGGIPEGSQTVIMGQPGTGKSLLAFQILYNNAKRGNPCTLILIDQNRDSFIKNVKFAFPNLKDINDLIISGTLNVAALVVEDRFKSREEAMLFIAKIIKASEVNKSKLIVIDEMSLLRALLSDSSEFTRIVNSITDYLQDAGITSVITMELPENYTETKIPGLFEESMFDCVIRLANLVNGDVTQHVAAVAKLRYSKYKSTSNLLDITDNGVVMKPVR